MQVTRGKVFGIGLSLIIVAGFVVSLFGMMLQANAAVDTHGWPQTPRRRQPDGSFVNVTTEEVAWAKVVMQTLANCYRQAGYSNQTPSRSDVLQGRFYRAQWNFADGAVSGSWITSRINFREGNWVSVNDVQCVSAGSNNDSKALVDALLSALGWPRTWEGGYSRLACHFNDPSQSGILQAARDAGFWGGGIVADPNTSCDIAQYFRGRGLGGSSVSTYLGEVFNYVFPDSGNFDEFSDEELFWVYNRTLAAPGPCLNSFPVRATPTANSVEIVTGFRDGVPIIQHREAGTNSSTSREDIGWTSGLVGIRHRVNCSDMVAALAPGSMMVRMAQEQAQQRAVRVCRDAVANAINTLPEDQRAPYLAQIERYDLSGTAEFARIGVNGEIECIMPEGSTAVAPPPIIEGDEPSTPSGTTDPDAWAACELGPFSWALCPLLEMASDAADAAYGWVEGQLQVQASQVQSLNNPSASGGASVIATFRNMANIFFIILALVAILSQLTGVGLSNYNIKRMLPRLLVVAVLANLSFFIAQIMVDLSNIVGHQVFRLLSGLVEYNPAPGVGEGATGSVLQWGVLTLGIVTAGVAALSWFSIGSLIMLFVSALLAFLLFAGVLMIRQIAILLLIALAPIAFVCLLLPSTEVVFKKWWTILKTMLILYPICGLLMGAGRLASAIVWNAGVEELASVPGILVAQTGDIITTPTGQINVMTSIMSMLLTILPFFAVIFLTKASLTALGGIGARITGAMVGARAGLAGGFAKSRLGQAAQADIAHKQEKVRMKQQMGRLGRFSQRRALQQKLAHEGSDKMVAHEKDLQQIQHNHDTGAGLERELALNQQKHELETNAASTAAKDRLAEQKFGQGVSDAALRQQATLQSSENARMAALAAGHNRMRSPTAAMQNEFMKKQARAQGEIDKQYASDLSGRVSLDSSWLKNASDTDIEARIADADAELTRGNSLAMESLGQAMQSAGQGDKFARMLSARMEAAGGGMSTGAKRNAYMDVFNNKELQKNQLFSVMGKYYGDASKTESIQTAIRNGNMSTFMNTKLDSEKLGAFGADSDATKAFRDISVANLTVPADIERAKDSAVSGFTGNSIAYVMGGASSESKADAVKGVFLSTRGSRERALDSVAASGTQGLMAFSKPMMNTLITESAGHLGANVRTISSNIAAINSNPDLKSRAKWM